jgi:AraC family transcriptional regulator
MSNSHIHSPATSPKAWKAAERFLRMQEMERPQNIIETRSLGPLSMMEIAQGAGSFPDVAAPVFNLQLMMSANCEGEFGYSGHKFQSWIHHGDIFLAPASCDCNYLLSAPHAIMMIPIPLIAVNAVTEHMMPSFGGDFSGLHSNKFRSDGLRKHLLSLWRGASIDAQALNVDAHGEAMTLIEELLRMAVDPSALRQVRHHLSPHARQRVLDYIDAHLAEDVSLPKLAQVAGLSEYYFMRAFKAELDITAHQYVLQQRIYRAIRLLRVTKTPIAQISLDCGFNDQAHLAHTFARVCGYPPSALRIKVA